MVKRTIAAKAMAKKTVTAKVFRVGHAPSVEEVDASLEGLQAIVGGYIEGIHLDPNCVNHHILYCNEDGRAKGLPLNLQLPNGVVVVGDAVMVLHNSDGEAIPLITEREPEVIREVRRYLPENESPIPWTLDSFRSAAADDSVVMGMVDSANAHDHLQKKCSALLEAAHFVVAYFLKRRAQGLEGEDAKDRLEALQKAVALAEGREGVKGDECILGPTD